MSIYYLDSNVLPTVLGSFGRPRPTQYTSLVTGNRTAEVDMSANSSTEPRFRYIVSG